MPLVPSITKEQTAAFAKVWDSGGIKIILDNTSIQFATDWANIVLKSFVADIAMQAAKVKAVKEAALKQANSAAPAQADAVATQTVAAPEPPKSRIVLTD